LEYYIKYGDKIKGKGGLIENGRDIFRRMMESSENQHLGMRPSSKGRTKSRSNSQSKNREPELPKVYR